MCNLMYHIAYNNKQHILAECYFIYCTNLSLSWLHSLQGVCCSSISAGSETIPRLEAHLSVSGLAGGRRSGETRLNRIQNPSQSRDQILVFYMNLKDPNALFLSYSYETQFRRLLILMKGAACSTVHIYTSLVLYIRNRSMGESR